MIRSVPAVNNPSSIDANTIAFHWAERRGNEALVGLDADDSRRIQAVDRPRPVHGELIFAWPVRVRAQSVTGREKHFNPLIGSHRAFPVIDAERVGKGYVVP